MSLICAHKLKEGKTVFICRTQQVFNVHFFEIINEHMNECDTPREENKGIEYSRRNERTGGELRKGR